MTGLFLLFLTCVLFETPSFEPGKEHSLSGIVYDNETKKPILFAHVSLGETGTVTNESGEFNLGVEQVDEYVLNISHMGYESHNETIRIEGKVEITVHLNQAVVELDPVNVQNGLEIMDEVMARTHINYDLDDQTMLSYYKEKLKTPEHLYYLAEGIIEIYLPSTTSTNKVQVSPIKTRKSVNDYIRDSEFFTVGGHVHDMVQSLVWREDTFLDPEQFKHYSFQFNGVNLYDGRNVLIVSFQPSSSKGKYSGKLFVDQQTFAIIRAEYSPDTSKSKVWERVTWVEEFDQRDGWWYLSMVSYKGQLWQEKEVFDFEALMVVNEIEKVSQPPIMGLLLEAGDQFFDEAEDFSEGFWEGFTHVKLDVEELASLN